MEQLFLKSALSFEAVADQIAALADSVKSGLITSLARPGSNIAGVSLVPALEALPKVLELLKEVVPQVSRVAILTDRTNPGVAS